MAELWCEECGQYITHLGTCSHSAMHDPAHPFHEQRIGSSRAWLGTLRAQVMGSAEADWPEGLVSAFERAEQEISAAVAAAEHCGLAELSQLRAERAAIQEHLTTLIEELRGAWWLKAANAYHALATFVGEYQRTKGGSE